MRIVQIINGLPSSPGGAERLVVDLAIRFAKAGNEVSVLLLIRHKGSFLRKELEDAGIEIFGLGENTNIYSPLNIFRIVPFLKKYDLIHVHLFPAQYWVAMAKIISRSKAHLVTTEHNTYNRRRDWKIFRWIDRFVYRRYKRIISISDATKKALDEHLGEGEDRSIVIDNGISVKKFREATACQKKEICGNSQAFLCVQVARFRAQKDQDTVIRALKLLPENVHAVFVGDGERQAECEALAESLGVKECAHFLGVRADVASLLKSADIAVQSSHWEGFGLAAAEAMATGKPVVASDVPGLREVVSGAGLLFPQGNEKALAQAVQKLLDDSVFYDKTAQACSERAEKFDISKMVEGYLGVYKSLFPPLSPRKKLFRLTTTAGALNEQLKGQLRFLNEHFEVVAVASGKEILQEIAEREGIRVIDVPMRREIALWQDVKSLLALFRLFRKERPDIVHANTPKASLLAMTAAFLARVPHRLYTVTGLRFETTTGSFRFLLKTMERFTCRFATKVIPEGDGVKNTLLRERITKKPLEKILNGNLNGINLDYFARTPEVSASAEKLRAEAHIIGSSSEPSLPSRVARKGGDHADCTSFSSSAISSGVDSGDHASGMVEESDCIAERFGTGQGNFVFGFVGRIVRDKGVNELVRAFAKLRAKIPACRLLLLGNFEDDLNPIADDVRAEIHREGSGIVLPGYQKDLRPYYAAMDALVHPSYREGFPNVVLQAGAMGVPCIVSDINGCNEIIREGENGTIVPPRDERALLVAMGRFLEERTTLLKMASKARELIASRYEQHAVWNATLEMYQQL